MGLSHKELSDTLNEFMHSIQNSINDLKQTQTHYKNANEDINKRHSDLIEKERWVSIGQLAAGVAHEINNPLGFVQNNIFALQLYFENLKSVFAEYQNLRESLEENQNTTDSLTAELKQLKTLENNLKLNDSIKDIDFTFNQCIDGLTRMSNITKSIKTFSHEDVEDEWEEFNLNVGIENMVVMSQNEYKYTTDIITDYGDIPLTHCSPNKLSQVFLNLIVNASHAIKATHQDNSGRGTITIKTYQNGDYIICEFSDDGCGIPDSNKTKIFNPFFTTKAPDVGTGLGLSICFDIVKKHNGEITVESEVDNGSTFFVKIPIVSQ